MQPFGALQPASGIATAKLYKIRHLTKFYRIK